MSVHLIRKARARVMASISELKRIDRRLTNLGCLNAYIHFKHRNAVNGDPRATHTMYLLAPQDYVTKKREYTYIGFDPEKQRVTSESVARYKLRKRLRARISILKRSLRDADAQLNETLTIYRQLNGVARDSVRSFAKNAQAR